jgi:thiamine biosynthesis lipoprotein
VAGVARYEACWSRFEVASELRVLNRCAGLWCPVSPLLWQAIEAAREAWSLTGGRFDPTILGRLEELGYDRTFVEIAPVGPPVAPPPKQRPSFADVELDASGRGVRLPPHAQLDLGGIGKGLAADLVADELSEDAVSVSIALGGDVAVRGPGPGPADAWPVPVVSPTGADLGAFPLVDEAIVQSTTALRRWRRGRRMVHHVVDPATGWPADTGVDSAVVTGPRAAMAEAVAKAAIIAGADDGLALVERAGLDGWLFLSSGERRSTSAVREDLGLADAG